MSKIVFFCIPAHGHTNPTLAVVRELIAQGHQVWYYSYEPLREKIEQTGAQFIPCDAYDFELKLSPQDGARIATDLALATKVLVETTLALDGPVCAQLRELEPDCIVGDSMAIWGRLLALKLNIPFVSSTTTFAFNRYSAKIMRQSPKEAFSLLFSLPKINRQLKRLRDAGFPIKNVLDILQNSNDTHTIVYTSPGFQPCADTFSDRYSFVGPLIRPITEPFHKQAAPLVYISMGTVNNDLLPLYQRCIEAFRAFSGQVVLSVGSLVDRSAFGALPPHISVHEHVDQIAVLEQADLFITHCGMNSVSEALSFGVPLLMLPQTPEQTGVAARVEQLHAGMPGDASSADALAAAARELLEQPAFRENAQKIAADFRTCSGAAGAAEKILSVCGAAR